MAISVGSKIPAVPKSVWEEGPEKTVELPSSGKYLLVGVPGAFTPPCSSQVPGYVENYAEFEKKGIKGIYVVAINDVFVTKAWKKTFDEKSPVHFVADSTGEFTKSLGLDFDAAGLLGNVRSKRYVAVIEDGVVKSLDLEDAPPNVTVTAYDELLKKL